MSTVTVKQKNLPLIWIEIELTIKVGIFCMFCVVFILFLTNEIIINAAILFFYYMIKKNAVKDRSPSIL